MYYVLSLPGPLFTRVQITDLADGQAVRHVTDRYASFLSSSMLRLTEYIYIYIHKCLLVYTFAMMTDTARMMRSKHMREAVF